MRSDKDYCGIIDERPLEPGHAVKHDEPLKIEEHQLASVAQNHLKLGIAVENASQDQAHELDTRLEMPPEREGGQSEIDGRAETGIIGVARTRRRNLRVDQQRHIEVGRTGECRLEDRMIQIFVADPPKKNGTLAAKFLDRSPQLQRRRGGLREVEAVCGFASCSCPARSSR